MKKTLSCLLYLGFFGVVSLPGIFSYQAVKRQKVKILKQAPLRSLASSDIAKGKHCESRQKWRHKCHKNNIGEMFCQPDRLQTFKVCKTVK